MLFGVPVRLLGYCNQPRLGWTPGAVGQDVGSSDAACPVAYRTGCVQRHVRPHRRNTAAVGVQREYEGTLARTCDRAKMPRSGVRQSTNLGQRMHGGAYATLGVVVGGCGGHITRAVYG